MFNRMEGLREELTVILDAATNGIVVVDDECRIVMFNSTVSRLTGKMPSSVIGMRVEEVIPEIALPDAVRTGRPVVAQTMRLGDNLTIASSSPIIKAGKIIGGVSVFQDVTGLQKVMTELGDVKNHADTLETVLELAYDGIVVVDRNGIITMFNRAYEEFLGVKRENVIGKHVTEVIENTRMHIVVKTGVPEIGWVQKIKGQEMVVQRIPIKKNGVIVGAVGKVMFKDVNELRAMAEKLNLAEKRLEYYEKELRRIKGAKYCFDDIKGSSEAILRTKELALRVARSNSTVLIRGQSGTGKELFAHAIHSASQRASGPFVQINCAAIPKELLESELFGYEPGAFTGARKGGKPGKFELADRGTIFLDEIGDMPLDMQAKVLRVLQEREVQKVGGYDNIPIDIRLIAATNKNLEKMISEGTFREDLYYRLNIVTLTVPPLRERKSDIPELVNHIQDRISSEMHIPPKTFSKEALKLLLAYHWPGNVRELTNVVERLLNTVDERTIQPYHLPLQIARSAALTRLADGTGTLKSLVEDTEKQAIAEALRLCKGNKLKAARLLGIPRSQLYVRLTKYGLQG